MNIKELVDSLKPIEGYESYYELDSQWFNLCEVNALKTIAAKFPHLDFCNYSMTLGPWTLLNNGKFKRTLVEERTVDRLLEILTWESS